MLPTWQRWMQAEDDHFSRNETPDRVDLVVDGQPLLTHDPDHEFIARRMAPR